MSIIVALQSAALAFTPVPASPHEEVVVPELGCLAVPEAEAAQVTYEAYLNDFSPAVIEGQKPDPELVALIDAEAARCIERYGWAEGSDKFAKLWTLGRLMQSGAWQNLPLGGDSKDKLAAALNERGEAGVALAAIMSRSKTADGFTLDWVRELWEETGLEDDEEVGEYMGVYMMGTYFRRFSREQFAELNVQEKD